jgi:hypothetical protein
MPRGELAGFSAGAKRVGRRWRVLQARPDGHGAILEVPALPAEGLRFGPGFQDQVHSLVGALARLSRVQVVAEVFVGGAAQQADDDAAGRQRVQHRHLLGDADRIADRYDRSEHGDLDPFGASCEPGGGNDRRRRQNAR